MGFLGVVPFRYWVYLGVVAVVVGVGWTAYRRIDAGGYRRCHAEWNAAVREAKDKRDAEVDVLRIRGDALSKALAEKERKFYGLQSEYMIYANSITGICDPRLGVLVAAASTSAPPGVPTTPAAPQGATGAYGADDLAYAKEVAAAVGANVAINYPRFARCLAQLNAVLDFNAASEETMK